MSRPYLRSLLLAGSFLLAPHAALAFETVDTMPWASGGLFYGYPAEELRPTEVYAQAGLMHDTNVLRRNAGAERDNIFRFGIGGRLDQRVVGRQGLHLEGRLDAYHFDRFSELDHFAYTAGAAWRWELGNDLSGTIGYTRGRRLAALAEVQRAVRRMVTTDDFIANGAWRVGPSLRLRGGYAYGRGERDTPGEDTITFGTRSLTAGVDYVTALGNAIGLEYRRTRGDAPVSVTLDPTGQFGNNDYEEREYAVVANYVSSPTLRFNGRVGHTERTYTDLPNNFSGPTYRAGVEWAPGPKTVIAAEAYREPRGLIDVVASHVVTRGFAFGPAWAATAKLAFSLRFVNEHRNYVAADPTVAPEGTLIDETLRLIRFGIAWEPQRLLQVGLGLDRGWRDSNTLGRDFQYTAAMANIKVLW